MDGFKSPNIQRLISLAERLGASHPNLSVLSSSMESTAMATNIKREIGFSIEVFDSAIRDAVNEFYEFSAVYREGNVDKFIEDVKTLDNILQDTGRKFTDSIRWSDDENYITTLRRPVSTAYLNVFTNVDDNRTVVADDFWKCLDLAELRNDIYRSDNFKSISSIFTVENSFDMVNRLLALVTGLRLNCVELSTSYEKTISEVIGRLQAGDTIPLTDTIDFNKDQSIVLGNVIEPSIVKTINEKWYHRKLSTTLGGMVEDVKLLLNEPLQYCSPDNSDNPIAVNNLFSYVKNEHSGDNIRLLQKEFLNIVEQIDLSSRRLSKIAEGLADIPEYNGNGGYVYVLRDITKLMHIYSLTLTELLKFTVKIAIMLENSFKETRTLVGHVKTLKIAIDSYVSKRIKV